MNPAQNCCIQRENKTAEQNRLVVDKQITSVRGRRITVYVANGLQTGCDWQHGNTRVPEKQTHTHARTGSTIWCGRTRFSHGPDAARLFSRAHGRGAPRHRGIDPSLAFPICPGSTVLYQSRASDWHEPNAAFVAHRG